MLVLKTRQLQTNFLNKMILHFQKRENQVCLVRMLIPDYITLFRLSRNISKGHQQVIIKANKDLWLIFMKTLRNYKTNTYQKGQI